MACLPNSFQIHLRKRCQIWRLLTAQILLKLHAFKAGEAAPGLNRVTQFQTSPRKWADLVTDLMDLSRTFFLLPESEKKKNFPVYLILAYVRKTLPTTETRHMVTYMIIKVFVPLYFVLTGAVN